MEATVSKSNIVKLMREIREKLSLDIMDMNFEEQKAYIKNSLKEQKEKRKTAHNKAVHKK